MTRLGQRYNRGFTLLEILLASVAAVILAAIYGVFVQAIHLRDRAAGRVRDSRLRARAERILRDDLNNALISGGLLAATLTGGTTSTGGPGGGAGLPGYLKFTAANGRSSSGDVASDVQQIEYYLTPGIGPNAGNGQTGGVLTRAVTRDLLGVVTQTLPKEEFILTGVQALQVQFYDGSTWQDSWQYTDSDPTGGASTATTTASTTASTTVTVGNSTLPTAVRVDVVLAPTAANGQPPPPIEVLVPWTTQFFLATPSPTP